MEAHLRSEIIAEAQRDELKVATSMVASSTGYPFKVALVPGTIADKDLYEARERKCDLGYLRDPYVKENGTIGYRCAGRAHHRLRPQGRPRAGHRGHHVPVQRPHGDVRPRPGPQRRSPGTAARHERRQFERDPPRRGGRDSYGAQDVIAYLSPFSNAASPAGVVST